MILAANCQCDVAMWLQYQHSKYPKLETQRKIPLSHQCQDPGQFSVSKLQSSQSGSQPDEAGPSAGEGNKIDCLKCSTISKFASPALPRPPLCPIWRMQASSRPAATQGRRRLASHGDTVCKTTLALNHDSYHSTA